MHRYSSKQPIVIVDDEYEPRPLDCVDFVDPDYRRMLNRLEARIAIQAFAMLKEHTKHPQRGGGDKMDIKLVTKDDRVIAIQNEGVTIVRLGPDDVLIEQTEDTAIIETTAKSKGKVVGTDRFTALLDIPEVRVDQLELLELAAAQAKVRCKNAVRAPGGGLSSTQKSILTALKEANPEAFAALLKSAEEDADLDDDELDVDEASEDEAEV